MEAQRDRPGSVRRGVIPAAILIVVAIVLVGAGVWLRVEAAGRSEATSRLASEASWLRAEANRLTSVDKDDLALTDGAATTEVLNYLTLVIEQAFSYDYADHVPTEVAVADNLIGKALCQYEQLFGEVVRLAPAQRLVLTAKVRSAALARLDGDRAEALIYFDQTSTRADTKASVATTGQLGVTAQRVGDVWKVAEFDLFGQPLVNGEPAPSC